MRKIAVDWSAYDQKEQAFEQALAEGTAELVDHPLPNGGMLSGATDEQVALAARLFEQRGQDLLAIAEWLLAKKSKPTHLAVPSKLDRLLAVLEKIKHPGNHQVEESCQ
jgi:hypothetical protein